MTGGTWNIGSTDVRLSVLGIVWFCTFTVQLHTVDKETFKTSLADNKGRQNTIHEGAGVITLTSS